MPDRLHRLAVPPRRPAREARHKRRRLRPRGATVDQTVLVAESVPKHWSLRLLSCFCSSWTQTPPHRITYASDIIGRSGMTGQRAFGHAEARLSAQSLNFDASDWPLR